MKEKYTEIKRVEKKFWKSEEVAKPGKKKQNVEVRMT